MTAYPLGLGLGFDLGRWFRTIVQRKTEGTAEHRLVCGIYSLWAGAWVSSVVIPLDWDRAWQKFPIPNAVGAMLFCLSTAIGLFVKDHCKCCMVGRFCSASPVAKAAKVASKIPKKTPAKRSQPVASSGSPAPSGRSDATTESNPASKPSPKRSPAKKATALLTKGRRSRSPSKTPAKAPAKTPAKKAAAAEAVPETPKRRGRPSKPGTPVASARASSRRRTAA